MLQLLLPPVTNTGPILLQDLLPLRCVPACRMCRGVSGLLTCFHNPRHTQLRDIGCSAGAQTISTIVSLLLATRVVFRLARSSPCTQQSADRRRKDLAPRVQIPRKGLYRVSCSPNGYRLQIIIMIMIIHAHFYSLQHRDKTACLSNLAIKLYIHSIQHGCMKESFKRGFVLSFFVCKNILTVLISSIALYVGNV